MVQGNRSTGKLYIIYVYTYTITLLKEWTGLEIKQTFLCQKYGNTSNFLKDW